MKNFVYFIRTTHDPSRINACLRTACETVRPFDHLTRDTRVLVKTHFGEAGNTGHVSPSCLRVLCDLIRERGATPVLTDTNTLYRGKRHSSADHLAIAAAHGFTQGSTGAAVLIPDENTPGAVTTIPSEKDRPPVHLVSCFLGPDPLVVVSHFKGHQLAGFGGALKNISMGCASRAGKLAQHADILPAIRPARCNGCGTCARVCPAHAIVPHPRPRPVPFLARVTVLCRSSRIYAIRGELCNGCGSCLSVCPRSAITPPEGTDSLSFQKKMATYAAALTAGHRQRIVFFNFAVTISKECDCFHLPSPFIAPDLGIFIGNDPVSVDNACYDMIVQTNGTDPFMTAHPATRPLEQLRQAAAQGAGSLEYQLIEIPPDGRLREFITTTPNR